MKLELSPQVHQVLKKIEREKKLYVLLFDALETISSNPYCGKKLVGQYAGMFSYRVQNWRIVYEIYKTELRILVIRIAQRREAFR